MVNFHFDFVVDAADADTILTLIRREALRCGELGKFGYANGECTEAEATWYSGRAGYLHQLLEKIKCSPVQS